MKTGRLAAALVLLSLTACGAFSSPVGAVIPKKPKDVALQQSETKGLTRCSTGGTMDETLAELKTSNPSSYDSTLQEWNKLKQDGATDAYFAIYASGSSACSSFTASSSSAPTAGVKVVGNLVVEFKNAADAQKAYSGGAFGIDPSQAGAGGAGTKTGSATGLGANSVSAFFSQAGYQIYFSLWQHDKWLAYIFAEGFSQAEGDGMAKQVDSRL